MIKYPKISPVGSDIEIQELQTIFDDELSAKWSTSEYDSYGRVYIEPKDRKPIIYIGSEEYIEVLADDTIASISFFRISDNAVKVARDTYNANCDIIFFVNLKTIYPNIAHRADEEARRDVVNLINQVKSFKVLSIAQVYDKVYDDMKFDFQVQPDMQPYHIFKIQTELTYNTSINC